MDNMVEVEVYKKVFCNYSVSFVNNKKSINFLVKIYIIKMEVHFGNV